VRYRLRWAKRGKLRFVSHHDEALIFERSVRRAGLPIAYSKGFSPHPKIAFGSGLPVGFASEVELLDIRLTDTLAPEEVVATFNSGLPEGLEILAASPLEPGTASLGAAITAARYEVRSGAPWLADALDRFMALDEYPLTRPYKGGVRTDDLRSGVHEASYGDGSLRLTCAIQPRSTRPSDVVAAMAKLMGEDVPAASYERTALLSGRTGSFEVLDETSRISKAAA
jgi:radical SAM-linked protein